MLLLNIFSAISKLSLETEITQLRLIKRKLELKYYKLFGYFGLSNQTFKTHFLEYYRVNYTYKSS